MPFEPFFPPPPLLTRELISRMGQRRAATLRTEAAAAPRSSDPTAYAPDELLDSIVEALENVATTSADADWQDQRWLSGVIYHFLGFQAGRARRGGKTEFTSSDLVEGLRDRLGLYDVQDLPLLEELAHEFSSWIEEQNNSYTAGWGMIVCDAYHSNTFRLEPTRGQGTENDERNSLGRRAEKKAMAAQGRITANHELLNE